jgi:predicted GIY-YIG superfamily endonuclease
MSDPNPYWVYVIQSQQVRIGKRGNALPGFHYVGMTTNPKRRIRQHNGEIVGGGRYTSKHQPWCMRAIYGPYADRSEALKAERALKKGKRSTARCHWSPTDTYKGVSWCRGLGVNDPRVAEINDAYAVQPPEPPTPFCD